VAKTKALSCVLKEDSTTRLEDILSSPNNILALEYLKALPNSITPVLVLRKGAGYHNTDLNTELPSASAIRNALFTADASSDASCNALRDAMPEKAYAILEDCIFQNALVNSSDLSEILGYRLLNLSANELSTFSDCSEELANTIRNKIANYQDFDSFCLNLKSKNYTYTRISRTLLHILLNIRESDIETGRTEGYAPYLRVLGFRKGASELLSAIKKEAQAPLITKVADYTSYFDNHTHPMMELDLHASALYQQILSTQKGLAPSNDYTHPIVIL
jgi:predicted nucleotidyltransferase